MMTTPWLLAGYDDYPTVRIEDVPSMQVEFSQNRDVSFGQNDCRVYGSNTTAIAAKLCLSAAKSGGLDAGETPSSFHSPFSNNVHPNHVPPSRHFCVQKRHS
jgi:hypothetical protein